MVCKNCGAEIDDNLNNCPYCGTENHKKAEEIHRNVMNAYEKQAQLWQEKPQTAARHSSYFVMIVIVGFIVIGVIAAGILFAVRRVMVNNKYNSNQKNLAKLEEIYQSGDYEKLYDTWESMSDAKYSSVYEKYDRICRMYQYVDWAEEYMDWEVSYAVSNDSADSLSGVEYLLEALVICKSCEDAGYVYEEEAGAEYFSDVAYGYLEDVYLLEEDEIDSYVEKLAAADYNDKETYFSEIKEISQEHLKEEKR